jgi:hypothetical protein
MKTDELNKALSENIPKSSDVTHIAKQYNKQKITLTNKIKLITLKITLKAAQFTVRIYKKLFQDLLDKNGLTSRFQAKKLYEGKYFYEIHRNENNTINLIGPNESIRYTAKPNADGGNGFVELKDGIPVMFFSESDIEILVTDRIL